MFQHIPGRIKGILFVLASAFMYASLPILTKIAYSSGLQPVQTLFLRYLFAVIILAPYLILIRREHISLTSLPVLAQGFFIVAGSLLYFIGLSYMPAGLFSVIFFTYPVIVAIIDLIVWKSKPDFRLIIAIVLAVIGVTLIFGLENAGPSVSVKGFGLGMLSSFCYALFTLIGQRNMSRNFSSLHLILIFCLLGAISLFALSVVQGSLPTHLSITQLTIIVAMALFNTILAVSLFLKGIHKIGASWASLISIAEPVLTLVLAFFVLGETRLPRELLGSSLIILSLLLAVLEGIKKVANDVSQNHP